MLLNLVTKDLHSLIHIFCNVFLKEIFCSDNSLAISSSEKLVATVSLKDSISRASIIAVTTSWITCAKHDSLFWSWSQEIFNLSWRLSVRKSVKVSLLSAWSVMITNNYCSISKSMRILCITSARYASSCVLISDSKSRRTFFCIQSLVI